MERHSAEASLLQSGSDPVQLVDEGGARQLALSIRIVSTFTADPLLCPMEFWMRRLEIAADVSLAPYGQVMQELLNPDSPFSRNRNGFNVVLIRLEDWLRDRPRDESADQSIAHLRRAANDFVSALAVSSGRTNASAIVVICPVSTSVQSAYHQVLTELQVHVASLIGSLARVHCLTHEVLDRLYPVADCEDPWADHIGHIPYTSRYFTAVATLLARRITALVKPRFKVIVLDCDNTLWRGVSGEDGAECVELTAAHLKFQQLLVRQHEAGVLLCLCSKNDTSDVEAVFRLHPEMPLQTEHIIAQRVNWDAKSVNLRSLAEELNLSLDSFVMIDDSAAECAEIQANCVSVLALRFPETPRGVENFLNHVWAFDCIEATPEARRRTAQYRENRERRAALQHVTDLQQFIASLELNVEVSPMQAGDLPRVAELVQRTNQFNLTTIRRRVGEIEAIWQAGDLDVLVVRVRDRFGDYGLVGALFMRRDASWIDIETFVLSCRALGRGVEQRIISELGRIARNEGRDGVLLSYRPAARNGVAREFLERAFAQFKSVTVDAAGSATGSLFAVPAGYAEQLDDRQPSSGNGTDLDPSRADPARKHRVAASLGWHEAAFEFTDVDRIEQEIRRAAGGESRGAVGLVAPRTPFEITAAKILADALGVARLGIHDHFFDLGGDSVRAVQAIGRMAAAFGVELSIAEFFEAATVEQIAAKLDECSRAGAVPTRATHVIAARTESDAPIPLSYAQERLWFLDQLGLVGPTYNEPLALRLSGSLDEDALERSFTELVARHESLRTRFGVLSGVPHQIVDPPRRFDLQRADLAPLKDPQEREEQLHHWIREEQLHLFDLAGGHPLRAGLMKVGPDECVLLLNVHHIAFDGWSRGVLLKELSTLYAAFVRVAPSPLQPLGVQYADYAIWQRQWLQDEVLADQLRYWKERLSGAPPQLQLPTDRPRPAVESFRGAELKFSLPGHLCRALKEIGRQQGATLFMVCLAAYQVLLSRWSGQQDIVVGSPIAGRKREELEALIGFFVNTLTLRAEVTGDLTFCQFLGRVKEVTLGAYEHQDLPFEAVVKELRPDRNLTRQPIFQVWLALQNYPQERFEFPGLTWTWTGAESVTAHFDLVLYLYERDDELSGMFEYATDLFDRNTIERIAGSFRTLVEGIVADPECRVDQLPLLSESEKEKLQSQWDATKPVQGETPCLNELFAEQVRRTPDAVAATYEGLAMTYAELDRRGDQLAQYLQKRGVGPDRLVAICVERSLEMVVGLLGILKAGGAYVPLDPAYPTERLAYMLADASPGVLLTQERLREKLPDTQAAVIALDSDWHDIAESSSVRGVAVPDLRSHHLAYVIYTSGSTGKPKGVMVEHRNVVRLMSETERWFGFNERDVWTLFHSFAFDFSVWELWGALLYGGRVVIVPYLTARSPHDFYQLLCTEHVTVLNQTPSAFVQLIDAQAQSEEKHSLRVVIFGGEALELHTLRRWVKRWGAERPQLVNMYGITETTVHVTYCPLSEEDIASGHGSLIGKPISDLKVYLLDQHRRPVPAGVVAEMYVGGGGVARGYLNRPALTAERFIADPFSGDPQHRLYKTGDVGRWRSDGTLEYCGRNDQQVKIRGYRIELGEIEAQIAQHAQVKDVVVAAREDVPGDKRLVAYVVARRQPEGEAAGGEAPEALRQELVSGWESVFQETYGCDAPVRAPSFVGWNSSYTGQPIPEQQMQEWLDSTIARINALQPQRVLEIGCGVGLLLQHLAPRCAIYVGTDFSASAVEQLKRWIRGREELKHVELKLGAATDLRGLPARSFDTVVLNSVAQYFPDIEYLLAVLHEAVRVLSPGGRIFVGDLRGLGALEMFHHATQLTRAAARVRVGQLRRRIARSIAQERELVIDPQFFRTLPGRVPGISAVTVNMRRGRAPNELTRYRYDVVLGIGERIDASPAYESVGWDAVGSLQELELALQERRWKAARLDSLPNSRLAREVAAQKLIERSDEDMEVGALKRQLNDSQYEGVDPESIWDLGEALGYDVSAEWSPASPDHFDVRIVDIARAAEISPAEALPSRAQKTWKEYATDPLEHAFRLQLIPKLREHLRGRVPAYMVPAAWVVLDRLPLTPNGKLDKQALPAPDARLEDGEHVEPRTPVERALADIWMQVLRVDQVGIHDNFFELGGHSLLIVQMMDSLRRAGLSANVRDVYASPTLADLAQVLTTDVAGEPVVPPNLIQSGCDVITPEMLPLVELEQGQINRIVAAVPGGAANVQDIYPLLPLQEGILFHHLLSEQRGDAYARPMLFALDSRQKLDALVEALQHVIDRHDVLRTAVLWENIPAPVQVVYRQATLQVETVQLDAERPSVAQLLERMRPDRHVLDLRSAPLMRLEVAAEPQGDNGYAVLHTHHLVFDNQSLNVLLGEVAACIEGRADQLPQPSPYRNYVAQALASARARDSEAFFRERLSGIEEPTAPFGVLDVHGDGSRIEEARQLLDAPLAKRIHRSARQLGVTAASLFHVAWALAVSRTSGRNEVVFGTVLLGRLQVSAGAQRILGMFINTLPLRVQLQNTTVGELVDQVHQELVELLNYEQASLAVAQRCSGVSASAPLFSTLLNYMHGAPQPKVQRLRLGSGFEVIASSGWTNYPITLSVYDQDEGFVLDMETDRSIDPQRMLGYMSTALHELVDAVEKETGTAVRTLSLLPAAEWQRVVRQFNATDTRYPREKRVHELFEAQVERIPGAVALIYEGLRLTYAELNSRANQLAHFLVSRGVRIGEPVPIIMSRSLGMLIAQLAVLKSGGMYVPVDPSQPSDRVNFLIRDCGARHVITGDASSLPVRYNSVEVVDCLHLASALEEMPQNNLELRVDRPCAAYVMYTSGSTGVPKGVVVAHHAINKLAINNGYAAIEPTDCIAHCSNPAFDASTFEVWAALLNGASVLIVPHSVVMDAKQFCGILLRERITVLWLTVGLFAQYSEALAAVFRRLRYLITGGDVVDPGMLRRVLRDSPPRHLLNAYGPTECTTFSTTFTVEHVDEGARSIPIGRPISNTQIHILDGDLRPVPVGVRGEIYIGGDGVALGYLNRPELTADRFLRDSFSPDSTARMYKSGDLGRWREDGTVEFLGRNDQQIKIRGFRVELGEIEDVLIRNERVGNAVVVVRQDGPGEKRLVAYVTRRSGVDAGAVELRRYVQAELPEYMVPSAFVVLPRLPLTPNGKVDRRALPVPELSAYARDEYEAPQGPIESIAARVWQELLRIDQIGRRDNFFELGGHSIIAIRMLSRINEAFGSALRVTDVYRYPTIQRLAAFIGGRTDEDELVELSKEAKLDEEITAGATLPHVPARAILLTGGAGFVGRFLLAELLHDTDVPIYCLVRATSQEQALSRLKGAMTKWDLWQDAFARRVIVVPGDLRRPRLGLDAPTYEVLAQDIDIIYHCATSMNHLESYAMARAANVEALKDLFKLATEHHPKRVNYISTLSIFNASSIVEARLIDETSSIDLERHASSEGYAASKWVGEKICMLAGERGISCNIFRLGLVWADMKRGRYDELQREYRVFKSCLLSGYGIEDYRYRLPPTPVDYVARAVVGLSNRHPEGRCIFHITAPEQRAAGVFEQYNCIADTPLKIVPFYDWICEIRRLHEQQRSLPVVPLVESAFRMDRETFDAHTRRADGANMHFESSRTLIELEAAGVEMPAFDQESLKLFVSAMYERDAEVRAWAEFGRSPVLTRASVAPQGVRAINVS